MPRYEYACPRCRTKAAVTENINRPHTIQNCILCGKPMERVFSPPTIIFKGHGFYCTDNRKGT